MILLHCVVCVCVCVRLSTARRRSSRTKKAKSPRNNAIRLHAILHPSHAAVCASLLSSLQTSSSNRVVVTAVYKGKKDKKIRKIRKAH